MTTSYEIQGLRNNERWLTLFAPLTAAAAHERIAELRETNPACSYRMRPIETDDDIMNRALAYYSKD